MADPRLAEAFEQNREHLRSMAQRMLGPGGEADDAVQEAWLRLERAEPGAIENLRAWLTTVVARICLDTLRSRKAHPEESFEEELSDPAVLLSAAASHPEEELVLADSVGLALMVVLDRLAPSERVAFVMHDIFGMSFDEIAGILGRTPVSTRQLASRARRRVQGATPLSATRRTQRKVVETFVAALRAGDFQALLAVLDPDLVVQVDRFSAAGGKDVEVRGAENWARGAVAYARAFDAAELSLVDGEVGVVMAPQGKLARLLKFTFDGERIVKLEVVGDPQRLAGFELAVLG